MTAATGRRILFVSLVCAFVVQTSLVYLDGAGYQTPRLSTTAVEGRDLWRENNCQSCHQIYGFGGFLGPDLTNSIQQLADERLQTILTEGLAPMPAFHFSTTQIEAISCFLAELDATGTGQFRFSGSLPAADILDQIIEKTDEQAPLSDLQKTGFQLLKSRKCIGCHLPNLQSTKRAPNLCNVISTPGVEGIAQTLRLGRIARGMPQFELAPDELEALISFLQWLHENQTEVETEFQIIAKQNAEAARIPWFEYDK